MVLKEREMKRSFVLVNQHHTTDFSTDLSLVVARRFLPILLIAFYCDEHCYWLLIHCGRTDTRRPDK